MTGEESWRKGWADALLIGLALLSVGMLFYELDHPEVAPLTTTADFFIALVFLADYANSILRAERRARYALTHWYDLLSSIPVPFAAVRLFRAVRVIRMVRLFRLLKLVRALSFLEESRVGSVAVSFLIICLMGALGFHLLEYGRNPNLKGSLDALYWAFTTLTTVGFGDIVAVTTGGKILTIALMASGIGVYGALAGLLAAYLVRGPREPEPDLDERLERVERKLEELSLKLEGVNPGRAQRRGGR